MTTRKVLKLKDLLPIAFFDGEYVDTRAHAMKDVEVVRKVDGCEERWPGKHRHVMNWYVLSNGYLVGWNENPGRGWSFPVMRIPGLPRNPTAE